MQIHTLAWFSEINWQSTTESPDCNFMFKEIVTILTMVNLQLLSVHFFSTFCQGMDSEHETLFPHWRTLVGRNKCALRNCEIGVRKVPPDTDNTGKDHFYHFKCLVYLSNTLSFFGQAWIYHFRDKLQPIFNGENEMSGLKQNKTWYKCLSHWEFDSFSIFNDFLFLIRVSKAMKSWVCLKATSRGCSKIKNCLTEHNFNQSRSGI